MQVEAVERPAGCVRVASLVDPPGFLFRDLVSCQVEALMLSALMVEQ